MPMYNPQESIAKKKSFSNEINHLIIHTVISVYPIKYFNAGKIS
jgi:hypothetical protein